MRRFPVVSALALALGSALASASEDGGASIESEQAFQEWRSATPFAPTAEQVGEAMAFYAGTDMDARPEAERLATAAFFGGVFSEHPEIMDALIERFVRGGTEQERAMTMYGLWLTGTEASRERLESIRDAKGPAHVRFFAARLLQTASPIGADAAIMNGMQLDMLWGRYLGSRAARPVERIIAAMGASADSEDVGASVVRGAARKSLEVMARQYGDVLEICRAAAEESDSAETRSALEQIIERATDARGARQSG